MTYDGATANLWRMDDVTKRLSMLLQGGVYLRGDLAAGGTTCTVGQDGADRNGGCDIPTQFFNGRSTPILATLEQETAVGSDVLETENVSISAVPAFATANYGLQVTLATGPSKTFATAKNARIRLRAHPVTGGSPPPVVKRGYIDFIWSLEPERLNAYNLPCLVVQLSQVGYDPDFGGNCLMAETYAYTCTWIRPISADEDIEDRLMQDSKTFMEMMDDDQYLGGGVECSEPIGPDFEPDAEMREAMRTMLGLDIIHFGVRCNRGELRNKFS